MKTVETTKLSNEEFAAVCAERPVEEAWQEFWLRFYPVVYRKVLRMLEPFGHSSIRSELDDIVQLVFMNILKRLPNYDREKSPFSAYLSLVTASTVIDELRRTKNKEPVRIEEIPEIAGKVSAGEIEADELWDRTVGVLKALSARDRDIIVDYLKGVDRQEIGQKYGIEAKLLYTITYRFRQALRKALKQRR
jgi:RNA polymerase sigma factor (sigma-70 family)